MCLLIDVNVLKWIHVFVALDLMPTPFTSLSFHSRIKHSLYKKKSLPQMSDLGEKIKGFCGGWGVYKRSRGRSSIISSGHSYDIYFPSLSAYFSWNCNLLGKIPWSLIFPSPVSKLKAIMASARAPLPARNSHYPDNFFRHGRNVSRCSQMLIKWLRSNLKAWLFKAAN